MIIVQNILEFYGNIRDETALVMIIQLPILLNLKEKKNLLSQTGNNGTNNIKTMVPLKYLRNFWRNIEMSLINCEINQS